MHPGYSKTLVYTCILLLLSLHGCTQTSDVLVNHHPEAIGFDEDKRLEVRGALQKAIESGKIAGATLLISDNKGDGILELLGSQGPDDKTPVDENTLFRIYSMTKPIVSVATMILVEQGKLSLSDPVSDYLPEYVNLKVLDEQTGETRPANSVMTIENLLTHESGLIYGVFDSESPLGKIYLENGSRSSDITARELAAKLGKLPLRFDPGTQWHYGRSTDVLGAVLEVVSGQTLDVLLERILFKPLTMSDTFFYVPEDKGARLAEAVYGQLSLPKQPGAMLSAGGGLVSSTRDYAQFGLMLINKGRYKGEQIISEETLQRMISPYIGQDVGRQYFFYKDKGDFGLGFGLVPINSESPQSDLTYGWGGYAGTEFWVDPANGFFVVYMIQAHSVPGGLVFHPRRAIYQSLSN